MKTIIMKEKPCKELYSRKTYFECSDLLNPNTYLFSCQPTDDLDTIYAAADKVSRDEDWATFIYENETRPSILYLTKNYKENFRTYIKEFIISYLHANKIILYENNVQKHISRKFTYPRSTRQELSHEMKCEINSILREFSQYPIYYLKLSPDILSNAPVYEIIASIENIHF